VRVRLTRAGAALRAKARDIPACILERTGLSVSELNRLQTKISKLRENLLKAGR
jgi:MarR family transcriptional regulator, organic hydroperoxide resistance regulator